MNLYHLRYFITLAHLEHYTKAAEELMITQPSLSHAISSLEGELGVSLFEKEGRNIVLTKYGRLFLADVEKSIDILDAGVKTLKAAGSGEGRIDLAFLRTLGTNYIPKIVQDFMKENQDKNIEFHFHTGITSSIIQGLKEKKYDLAVCSRIEKEQTIEFTPVSAQELVLIVPTNHPLAKKDTVDLVETLPYPQIYFTKTSGLRYVVDNLFKKIGQTPTIAYEIEEDQVIAGMVAQDFGIAVVPRMAILQFLHVKTLHIASPSWERKFYLAALKDRYMPPAVKQLKSYMIDHAEI